MLNVSYILFGTVLFFLGSSIGSFINVLVYRAVQGGDWLRGRSECEHCHKRIAWYDLFPILSFLLLGGRCRYCRKRISLIHPVVEGLLGLLFVWWYFIGSLFFQLTATPYQAIQPAFWLLAGILLLVILVADLLYYIVPDIAVAILLILTVVYRLILVWGGQMQLVDLQWAAAGMIVLVTLFFCLHYFTRGRGFGLGDVKLAAPLALLLGWPKVVVGVLLAFMLGAIVGLFLVATGKRKFSQAIPFAPFLVAGTMLALVFGQQIWQSYLSLL